MKKPLLYLTALVALGLSLQFSYASNVDCNIVTDVSLEQCNALSAFYDEAGGANRYQQNNWINDNTPDTVCDLQGITCNNGIVVNINLQNNNLSGSISTTTLQGLSGMTEMLIGGNYIKSIDIDPSQTITVYGTYNCLSTGATSLHTTDMLNLGDSTWIDYQNKCTPLIGSYQPGSTTRDIYPQSLNFSYQNIGGDNIYDAVLAINFSSGFVVDTGYSSQTIDFINDTYYLPIGTINGLYIGGNNWISSTIQGISISGDIVHGTGYYTGMIGVRSGSEFISYPSAMTGEIGYRHNYTNLYRQGYSVWSNIYDNINGRYIYYPGQSATLYIQGYNAGDSILSGQVIVQLGTGVSVNDDSWTSIGNNKYAKNIVVGSQDYDYQYISIVFASNLGAGTVPYEVTFSGDANSDRYGFSNYARSGDITINNLAPDLAVNYYTVNDQSDDGNMTFVIGSGNKVYYQVCNQSPVTASGVSVTIAFSTGTRTTLNNNGRNFVRNGNSLTYTQALEAQNCVGQELIYNLPTSTQTGDQVEFTIIASTTSNESNTGNNILNKIIDVVDPYIELYFNDMYIEHSEAINPDTISTLVVNMYNNGPSISTNTTVQITLSSNNNIAHFTGQGAFQITGDGLIAIFSGFSIDSRSGVSYNLLVAIDSGAVAGNMINYNGIITNNDGINDIYPRNNTTNNNSYVSNPNSNLYIYSYLDRENNNNQIIQSKSIAAPMKGMDGLLNHATYTGRLEYGNYGRIQSTGTMIITLNTGVSLVGDTKGFQLSGNSYTKTLAMGSFYNNTESLQIAINTATTGYVRLYTVDIINSEEDSYPRDNSREVYEYIDSVVVTPPSTGTTSPVPSFGGGGGGGRGYSYNTQGGSSTTNANGNTSSTPLNTKTVVFKELQSLRKEISLKQYRALKEQCKGDTCQVSEKQLYTLLTSKLTLKEKIAVKKAMTSVNKKNIATVEYLTKLTEKVKEVKATRTTKKATK